jgi:hypothetical protein
VLVYQHSFREKNWVEVSLRRVAQAGPLRGCAAFAYWAGNVGMVFIARERQRLYGFRRVLEESVLSLPRKTPRVISIKT